MRISIRVVAVLLACMVGRPRATVAQVPQNAPDAQDAPPALRHYHHTAWRLGEDIPVSDAFKILRSPDGYLWLSSSSALVRFDGVRFTVFDGRTTPALGFATSRYRRYILMLVDRGGRMWLMRPDGTLVTYADGVFRVAFPARSARESYGEVFEDGTGALWVVTNPGGSRTLQRIRGDRLLPATLPRNVPDSGVIAVVADTADGMWIGTHTAGLWHVTPRSGERVSLPPSGGGMAGDLFVRPVRQTRDGTLWVTNEGGNLWRRQGGTWTSVTLGAGGAPVRTGEVVADADGSIYSTTRGHGLVRWRDGQLDTLGTSDGLTSAVARAILIDAEGSLWVLTDAGLDRLRRAAFATLDRRDGMPIAVPSTLAVDALGALWATAAGDANVYRLDDGVVRARAGPISARRVPLSGVGPSLLLAGAAAAAGGGVWAAPVAGGLVRIGPEHVVRVGAVPMEHGRIERGAESRDGVLWLKRFPAGMGRLQESRYSAVAFPGIGDTVPTWFATDVAHRSIWILSWPISRAYALAGPAAGDRRATGAPFGRQVSGGAVDTAGALWALAGDGSTVIRLAGGQVRAVGLRTPRSQLIGTQHAVIATSDALWFGSEAGVGRLSLPGLRASIEHHAPPPSAQIFTRADGLTAPMLAASAIDIERTPDGRLWWCTPAGLAVVDPARVPTNPVAPHVHVEEVTLGEHGDLLGTSSDAPNDERRIPPNPTRVTIHYTAASLRMPERVRVQYLLEGVDRAWVDGGVPRAATYTQLRPGHYRFRVRAWNEDGVPSAHEATLALRVLPAWYQTWWAMLLGVAVVALGGAGGAWAVARARQRRIEAATRATMTERARVARELHDTLLSGFAGVAMSLDAAATRAASPRGVDVATLGDVRDQAYSTLADARRSVSDLRALSDDAPPLEIQLADAARRIFADTDVDAQIAKVGAPRRLDPAVAAEVCRVVAEAMTNARKHADCRTVVVTCTYGRRDLRVRVCDDGRGFDPDHGERGAHWGILGMRERASAIRARLTIESAPGRGTDVLLVVRG